MHGAGKGAAKATNEEEPLTAPASAPPTVVRKHWVDLFTARTEVDARFGVNTRFTSLLPAVGKQRTRAPLDRSLY